MGNESWHGTAGGYTNHGCRQSCCRVAYTDYQRGALQRWRDKKKARLTAEVVTRPVLLPLWQMLDAYAKEGVTWSYRVRPNGHLVIEVEL